MVPSKRTNRADEEAAPTPVDIRERFLALHARIGKGGLALVAARKRLPKLEQALLSLIADVKGAYEGASEARAVVGERAAAALGRFQVRGQPIEPPAPKAALRRKGRHPAKDAKREGNR